MSSLLLRPGRLTLAELRRVWSGGLTLAVDPAARAAVDASAATVVRVLAEGHTVYGVNTGFGLLARTRIDDARLTELRRHEFPRAASRIPRRPLRAPGGETTGESDQRWPSAAARPGRTIRK
jgi:histidine ammonia-lyase